MKLPFTDGSSCSETDIHAFGFGDTVSYPCWPSTAFKVGLCSARAPCTIGEHSNDTTTSPATRC